MTDTRARVAADAGLGEDSGVVGPPRLLADETVDAESARNERAARRRGDLRAARLQGAADQVTIDLGTDRVVLGRLPSDSTSVPIPDAKMSRDHFAVEWDTELKCHVGRDLDSRNGTWIDGRRNEGAWVRLEPGTVLRVGDTVLVYELGYTLENRDSADVSREAVPGHSAAIRALRRRLASAAPDISPVLIVGQTGTGKEQIAREIHRLSQRGPSFVAVNCATLSHQLIESQLFGHKKGAFTGATDDQPGFFREAEGGTLFLDEIGELPVELQPKLLRAIQELEITPVGSTKAIRVDVRIVAATLQDLEARARDRAFRQDLYARLSLWKLEVPSLRDRRSDIPQWLDILAADWSRQRQRVPIPMELEPEAREVLVRADWPDNLRGLNRLVHELASTSERERPIGLDDLPEWVRG